MAQVKFTQAQVQEMIKAAVAQALAETQASKPAKSKGKKKTEVFVKKDGTQVACTAAQAKAWDAYRNRERMTVEELKAIKPEITAAGKAYVKANPACTQRQASANGCKGITKEGLKALKRELGVR